MSNSYITREVPIYIYLTTELLYVASRFLEMDPSAAALTSYLFASILNWIDLLQRLLFFMGTGKVLTHSTRRSTGPYVRIYI